MTKKPETLKMIWMSKHGEADIPFNSETLYIIKMKMVLQLQSSTFGETDLFLGFGIG